MVEIKKGETIIATDVKSGTSAKGDYWMCNVKSASGKEKITVWCAGLKAVEGDVLRVVDITEVKKSRRQYQEKWYDNFDVTAVLEVDGGGYKAQDFGADFAELDDDPNNSDLPF